MRPAHSAIAKGVLLTLLLFTIAPELRELQAGLDASSGGVDAEAPTAEPEEAAAIDARSVYVGNVGICPFSSSNVSNGS